MKRDWLKKKGERQRKGAIREVDVRKKSSIEPCEPAFQWPIAHWSVSFMLRQLAVSMCDNGIHIN